MTNEEVRPLRAEDYPALAKLWDNEDDAIYDEPDILDKLNDLHCRMAGVTEEEIVAALSEVGHDDPG